MSSLSVYADGVDKLATQVKSDEGWLRGLAIALREADAEIARLTAKVRPFSDALAQKVIETQVKELDRQSAEIARLTAEFAREDRAREEEKP